MHREYVYGVKGRGAAYLEQVELEERLDADPELADKVYKKLAATLVEHGTGAVLLFGTIKTETK